MKWVWGLVSGSIFFLMALSAFAAQEEYPVHPAIWDTRETAISVLWDRVVQAHQPVEMPPEPTLINGTVPDMKDFPATSFTGSCTTTVIGENVAIIAAHCTSGMSSNITFPIGASRYTAKCDDASDYRQDTTADWSLCKVTKKVEGIEYEVINLDPALLGIGEKVLLGGYGCTDVGGRGGIDGQFRIGLAEIVSLPDARTNDIVTKNGAALCYGDSGGAAWSINPSGVREKLISINSRGDIRTTSYLSALHTEKFKKFIDSWTAANPDARICGYHADATDCRGAEPPGPIEFELSASPTKLKVTVNPGVISAQRARTALTAAGF